jgi:hypothetical protein
MIFEAEKFYIFKTLLIIKRLRIKKYIEDTTFKKKISSDQGYFNHL